MSTPDFHAIAATITGALIARKTPDVDVRTDDAAKLFWRVYQELVDSAPKGKATVAPLRT